MRINLIRHSTTAANEMGIVSGARIDLPLSPQGVKIIEDLKAQGIYPEEPGVIYASELKRAIETIQIIYPSREIHKRAILNERDFGDLEYYTKEQSKEYIKKSFVIDPVTGRAREDMDNVPPNGESIRQLNLRARKAFNELYDEFKEKGYELVTICGHGSLFRSFAYEYDLPGLGGLGVDKFLDNGKGFMMDVEKKDGDLDIKVAGFIGGNTAKDVLIDYMKRYEKE
ncbi:MAG: histidine phosphatase family protein [Erysipelotrichaceae bacterium]|nr:histidine phosphatase family protein [Erysipelotrichaceae bacterium]